MKYEEFIAAALEGRDTRVLANRLGMSIQQLENYRNYKSVPGYAAAMKLAREAGLDDRLDLVFQILADEEMRKKGLRNSFLA